MGTVAREPGRRSGRPVAYGPETLAEFMARELANDHTPPLDLSDEQIRFIARLLPPRRRTVGEPHATVGVHAESPGEGPHPAHQSHGAAGGTP